ncbi:hypothetical protein ACWGDT_08730 [Streptomyces avermitilis]
MAVDLDDPPLRAATIYEHAERSNEPIYRDVFASDILEVCHQAGLTDASWSPFDERREGVRPDGRGERRERHFPRTVLSAAKPEQ